MTIDQKWRDGVEQKLKVLDERSQSNQEKIDGLAANVGAALTIHAANAEQIAQNTRITIDIRDAFADFQKKAMPVVSLHADLVKGGELVGKLANWLHKWGKIIFRIGVTLGAFYVMIMAATSHWAESLRNFMQGK